MLVSCRPVSFHSCQFDLQFSSLGHPGRRCFEHCRHQVFRWRCLLCSAAFGDTYSLVWLVKTWQHAGLMVSRSAAGTTSRPPLPRLTLRRCSFPPSTSALHQLHTHFISGVVHSPFVRSPSELLSHRRALHRQYHGHMTGAQPLCKVSVRASKSSQSTTSAVSRTHDEYRSGSCKTHYKDETFLWNNAQQARDSC